MTSSRRTFLKAGAAGAWAVAGGAPLLASRGQGEEASAIKAPRRRPNLLLFFPDQWRFDWMSTNPELQIRTPNLDRIRNSGTRFTNVLVPSALCAPSRASIASGLAYGKTGVHSNQADYPVGKIPTFYGMLRGGGYHVLGCGKFDLAKVSDWWGTDGKWRVPSWGFSDGINNAGKIDQLISYRLNNNEPADPYTAFLQSRGLLKQHLAELEKRRPDGYAATFPASLPEDAYCDNWLGQNGLLLLEQAPKDRPWFLQVNFNGPHSPEDVTERMAESVRNLKMPPPNGKNRYDAATNQAIRRNYTAMCENIDRIIGLYLDWLTRSGEIDNTVIAFASDHGEMLGDHGHWGKVVPYQPSASVPLLISGPGVQRGVTSSALANTLDLPGTFLDFAGISPSHPMDSRSLRPVLQGGSQTHRDVLFCSLGGWRIAFNGRYKVIRGYNPDGPISPEWTIYSKQVRNLPPLVFDLVKDPGENHNLVGAAIPPEAQRLLDLVPAVHCG